jgi:hypothetical protein
VSVLTKAAAGAAVALLLLLALIAAAATAVISILAGGLLEPTAQENNLPDTGPVTCTAPGGIHGAGLDLDPEQAADAAVIARVAHTDGLPARAVVIALATALQESRLRNLPYGDRDSLGLFQQRPSQGWGSPAQILNPSHATQQFYTHLMRVPDWWSIPLWKAAQAVQNSAIPTAYQQWQQEASTIQEFTTSHPHLCSPT